MSFSLVIMQSFSPEHPLLEKITADEYKKVSQEDILSMAKEYFQKNNSTVGFLISPEEE